MIGSIPALLRNLFRAFCRWQGVALFPDGLGMRIPGSAHPLFHLFFFEKARDLSGGKVISTGDMPPHKSTGSNQVQPTLRIQNHQTDYEVVLK